MMKPGAWTVARNDPGYAASLGHASPSSACPSRSWPTRCAGSVSAHHMLTNGRRWATSPSPVLNSLFLSRPDLQDRRVSQPDTYVYLFWLVYGGGIHVTSLSYPRVLRRRWFPRDVRPGGRRWISQPT